MIVDLPVLSQTDKVNETLIAVIRPAEEKPKEPIKYTVVAGDSLTKLATTHQTTVQRLWEANTQLTDPNLLEVNQELIIPLNTDVLSPREFPAIVEVSGTDNRFTGRESAPSGRSSVSGNTWSFPWGWCTFFASQARPDLPVRGNAADWIAWANSTTPQVGAVAVNTSGYGHVAIVLEIGEGEIKVRHMNWSGFGVVTDDWIDLSYWSGYIY